MITTKRPKLFGPAAAVFAVLTILACDPAPVDTLPTAAPLLLEQPTPTPAPTGTVALTPAPTDTPTPAPTEQAGPTATLSHSGPSFSSSLPFGLDPGIYGEPVRGGILRVAYSGTFGFVNAWRYKGSAVKVRAPTGATLVMENPYDQQAPLVPDLAKAWDIHPGSDGVTFHFRENTRWHSGERFVCEDARHSLWTIARAIAPGFETHRDNTLTHLEPTKIKCLNDLTLEISVEGPTAVPLRDLTTVPT